MGGKNQVPDPLFKTRDFITTELGRTKVFGLSWGGVLQEGWREEGWREEVFCWLSRKFWRPCAQFWRDHLVITVGSYSSRVGCTARLCSKRASGTHLEPWLGSVIPPESAIKQQEIAGARPIQTKVPNGHRRRFG